MKTLAQSHESISGSVRSRKTMLVNRILLASAAVKKYAYLLLCVFIFFACQKNLTQIATSPIVTIQQAEAPVEGYISMDVLDVLNHKSSLCLSDLGMCKRIQDKLIDFYQGNSLETKWMKPSSPSPLFFAFLDHLKNADRFGLNAETYHADYIEELVNKVYKTEYADTLAAINADIQITETFFLFSIHLTEGRITNPGYGDKIWITPDHATDNSDVAALINSKRNVDLDETIKNLQPSSDLYVSLQKMLIRYRTLARSEFVQSAAIAARSKIKAGTTHEAMPAIRKRLSLMEISVGSDLSSNSADSLLYDSALELAVKIFQQRHGLEPDGVISDKTITWLNMSFKERADLIALNMERMRWSPVASGKQSIRVNIPEYKLRIYDQGTQMLEMNVIVGAVSNATPVFNTTLESIVFSPTWTVPSRIIKEEFVPRLIKDKTYYAERKNFTFYKKGIEIDPATERWDSAFNVNNYRIVQQPGADNALGLVKFVIRNSMNIYMHDTPNHKPFSHHYRALSHGCIRLDNPAKLAAYLLEGDAAWDSKRIHKAMTSGQTQKTNVKKQFEVQLEYRTAWVDHEGNLNFRDDIYGHDERQLKTLYPINVNASLVARVNH